MYFALPLSMIFFALLTAFLCQVCPERRSCGQLFHLAGTVTCTVFKSDIRKHGFAVPGQDTDISSLPVRNVSAYRTCFPAFIAKCIDKTAVCLYICFQVQLFGKVYILTALSVIILLMLLHHNFP